MHDLVIASQRGMQPVDAAHMRDLHAAIIDQSPPRVRWALWMIAATLVAAGVWASQAVVEEVTHASGRVVSHRGDQLVQSLEGGIVARLPVHTGDRVEIGDVLVEIDATRANAVFKEGLNKQVALQASAARLRAEAYGQALAFPPDVQRYPELVRNETQTYDARKAMVEQGVADLQRSLALAEQEISMSEGLHARGLIPDIEMLRMKRQANDLRLQISERRNKYKADANNELVRVESELSQARENTAARADTAKRTVVRSQVRGIVKEIKINTLGGVVPPGGTVMELSPLDEQLLVEAKVRPQDIAFLRPGLPATVKVAAYDYSIYGMLDGEVEHISPDTLREESRAAVAATGEETYYRVLVRTRQSGLQAGGKDLPILPGMTTTVDIRSGEKTVLDYLLKPVFKAREAFRER